MTELTLYCAGNYADSLHFTEAGDLLVNPRLVLVTGARNGRVYAKERHKKMSEQFRSLIGAGEDPVLWLKKEMTPQIREEALLPELLGRMKHDSCLSEGICLFRDREDEEDRRLRSLSSQHGRCVTASSFTSV